MKIIILSFILFLFTSFDFQINNEETIVIWNKNRPLKWEDFQGIVPKNTQGHGAVMAAMIIFDFGEDSINNLVLVTHKFIKTSSWSLPKYQSTHCLKHEQTHFDISELYARHFKKEVLKEYKKNHEMDYSAFFSILQKVNREKDKMQTKFDNETQHSLVIDKERYWEDLVAKKLDSTAKWDSNIPLKLKKNK